MPERSKTIVLMAAGQPSTNPRLLKEAVFLAESGFQIFVLYSFWAHWAIKTDEVLKKRFPSISWIETGGNPYTSFWRYGYTRIRHKLFRVLSRFFPKSLFLAERALLRNYSEMLHAGRKIDASLYIAHNPGPLAVTGRVAQIRKKPFAFDAEDFHRGQFPPESALSKQCILIENIWMHKARYCTAASPLIAKNYADLLGINCSLINNVFSIRYLIPDIKPVDSPVRLFWFSQSIGCGRGLEDIILALKEMPKGSFTLTLMGDCREEFKSYLRGLAKEGVGGAVDLHFLPPVDPETVFSVVGDYDIGLALEPGRDLNNSVALSNKIFTYLLGGLAVILSSTPAQESFFDSHSDIGWKYPCGDIAGLTDILLKVSRDREEVTKHKYFARQLAKDKFNWEMEQVKFRALVDETLQEQN